MSCAMPSIAAKVLMITDLLAELDQAGTAEAFAPASAQSLCVCVCQREKGERRRRRRKKRNNRRQGDGKKDDKFEFR